MGILSGPLPDFTINIAVLHNGYLTHPLFFLPFHYTTSIYLSFGGEGGKAGEVTICWVSRERTKTPAVLTHS